MPSARRTLGRTRVSSTLFMCFSRYSVVWSRGGGGTASKGLGHSLLRHFATLSSSREEMLLALSAPGQKQGVPLPVAPRVQEGKGHTACSSKCSYVHAKAASRATRWPAWRHAFRRRKDPCPWSYTGSSVRTRSPGRRCNQPWRPGTRCSNGCAACKPLGKSTRVSKCQTGCPWWRHSGDCARPCKAASA